MDLKTIQSSTRSVQARKLSALKKAARFDLSHFSIFLPVCVLFAIVISRGFLFFCVHCELYNFQFLKTQAMSLLIISSSQLTLGDYAFNSKTIVSIVILQSVSGNFIYQCADKSISLSIVFDCCLYCLSPSFLAMYYMFYLKNNLQK